MPVAAEPSGLHVEPGLDEVRELAREHTVVPLRHTFVADIETPVSAYLKLRGDGPSFLLESAEQGQRFGRWSFLGYRPRTVIRLEEGRFTVGGERAGLLERGAQRELAGLQTRRGTRHRCLDLLSAGGH